QQVCIIFAGVNGFLDKIPVARVVAFEKAFLPYLAIEHKGLLEKIRTTGVLSPELEAELREITRKFAGGFM
ncbi:MAG: ATP synthase, H+ transporting, mitochondrial F1 complex, alpha subunit, isoform 1, isoform CRA_h, partial [Olpidium bornovanus]